MAQLPWDVQNSQPHAGSMFFEHLQQNLRMVPDGGGNLWSDVLNPYHTVRQSLPANLSSTVAQQNICLDSRTNAVVEASCALQRLPPKAVVATAPPVSGLSLEAYLDIHTTLTKGTTKVQPLSQIERAFFKMNDLKQVLQLHGLSAGSRKKQEILDCMVGLELAQCTQCTEERSMDEAAEDYANRGQQLLTAGGMAEFDLDLNFDLAALGWCASATELEQVLSQHDDRPMCCDDAPAESLRPMAVTLLPNSHMSLPVIPEQRAASSHQDAAVGPTHGHFANAPRTAHPAVHLPLPSAVHAEQATAPPTKTTLPSVPPAHPQAAHDTATHTHGMSVPAACPGDDGDATHGQPVMLDVSAEGDVNVPAACPGGVTCGQPAQDVIAEGSGYDSDVTQASGGGGCCLHNKEMSDACAASAGAAVVRGDRENGRGMYESLPEGLEGPGRTGPQRAGQGGFAAGLAALPEGKGISGGEEAFGGVPGLLVGSRVAADSSAGGSGGEGGAPGALYTTSGAAATGDAGRPQSTQRQQLAKVVTAFSSAVKVSRANRGGADLIGCRVLYVLLQDFEQAGGRGKDVLHAGLHVGRVVEYIGAEHQPDCCPRDCEEGHHFFYVREKPDVAADSRGANWLDLKLDLHPRLRARDLDQLNHMTAQQLEDVWLLAELVKPLPKDFRLCPAASAGKGAAHAPAAASKGGRQRGRPPGRGAPTVNAHPAAAGPCAVQAAARPASQRKRDAECQPGDTNRAGGRRNKLQVVCGGVSDAPSDVVWVAFGAAWWPALRISQNQRTKARDGSAGGGAVRARLFGMRVEVTVEQQQCVPFAQGFEDKCRHLQSGLGKQAIQLAEECVNKHLA